MGVREIAWGEPVDLVGPKHKQLGCLSWGGEGHGAERRGLVKSLQILSKCFRFMAFSRRLKFLMRCMNSDLINCSIKCKYDFKKFFLKPNFNNKPNLLELP